jgi:hypothetical protein
LDSLNDIFEGSRLFFTSKLTQASEVVVGFGDERTQDEENREYPAVAITLYDLRFDNQNKTGGVNRYLNIAVDGHTASVTKPPVPVDLYFQLDTECETRAQEWALLNQIIPIIGNGHTKFLTPLNRKMFITPFTGDITDDISDGLFCKALRFILQAWFASVEEATEVYLVWSKLKLILNGEELNVTPAPYGD